MRKISNNILSLKGLIGMTFLIGNKCLRFLIVNRKLNPPKPKIKDLSEMGLPINFRGQPQQ